jgi:predicted ATPase/serine phosphatase RsbU (regulator of sigma subunit)/tRNA A-37 threonylcarbamoyl transferase component Bud32
MSNLAHTYTATAKVRDLVQAALYRGHRDADHSPVLLKIPSGDRPSAAQVARLRHEYSILRSLRVPGVVKPLGLEKVGDSLALVLENVGEESLDRGAGSQALDLPTFLRVAISMARVLESVHRHHIIHKDIKPGNFTLNAGWAAGEVTLIDFTVATRLSLEDRRATSVNRLEGTLAYMSPEQTGRMNRVLDRRTDLYSLGVTFYELLTGVLPFRTSDPLELVHSHIARTPVPPHAIAPATPPMVSAIVMKLLSKNAEDRYQDVGGLRADLERCLELAAAGGEIASFPLGEQDFSDELRIPQKLYGREADAARLLETFDRTRRGATELLLISGYSGVGKSALVNEIQRQIVRGGRFIAGKFDQLGRRVPYLPITRACGDLLRSILTEPPETLAGWRQKILEALGPNGQVVVDLVPELQLVIGPQPKVQALGPSEAQHRFEQAFQSFLQVFTSAEHPLAFFLDDLQWADPASLRLIHLLLTSPRRSHLLVIGAYRENEVDPVHPLALALADLRKAGAPIQEMKLAPLTLSDVGQLLTDTLGRDRTESDLAPLAALVLRKTHGNPFFLNQFVTDLHRKGLLAWNPATRRWAWSLDRIEGATATENVIDFMIAKLRRLGQGPQRALSLAACIGHQFDRRTLAVILEQPPAEVAALLWEALGEGLIVPLDANQGFLHHQGDGAIVEAGDDELNPAYRFLHDRVQQAAYALIAEAQKQDVHLRIGRLMMAGAGGGADDRLFDVVNHMNFGAALIGDREERRALARLNLQAGRKARDAIAYGMAVKLLANCQDLLGEGALHSDGGADYDIAYPACLTQAECAFVDGDVDGAFRLLDLASRHARTTLDRVAALKLRTLILSNLNRMDEAIVSGLETARLLGMEFPRPDGDLGPAIGAELGALGAALAERSVESLIDLPVASDPEAVALLDVLYGIIPAAAQTNTALMVLTVAKAVNLALQRGNSRVSSYFYICYGMVLAGAGDLETGYRLGQLGIRLNERMDVHAVSGANHFVFGAFVSFWRRPLSESLEQFAQGLKAGLDAGDYLHAAYCITFLGLYRLYMGESLDEVAAELAGKAELLARTGNVVNERAVKLVGQLIACFRGQTAGRGSLAGPGFDAAEFERAIVGSGNRFLISTYYLCWAIARYFAGDYAGALADLEKAVPAVPPELTRAEITFFAALARAGRLRAEPAGAGDRSAALAELAKDEETLRAWAASSPGTFGHRHALVAAELASLSGDSRQALTLYERAVTLAQEAKSVLHEALANELCSKLAAAEGWTKVASLYRQEARAAYQRWGATAKVQEIAPDLTAGHAAATAEVRAEQLDALSFVKASQAISTEIVLAKLIQSLMRIVIEQAGAERGFLILLHDGELWVEGVAGTVEPTAFERFRLDADDGDVDVGAGHFSMPRSIIGYSQRTKEKVLIGDTDGQNLFAADAHLRNHRPRSLLCLPMVRQGDLVGLLYLENSLTGGAFTPDRVELLEVLSSQAAVSLENAILYDEMEKRVEERTRELEASLQLLKKNQAQLIEAERRTAVAHYEREMAIARQIQTSILPKRLAVPGMEIAAAMITASEVGGDYYDLQPTEDGGCWLGIGDVSGHGLNAGLMMLMIQSSLGTLMRRDPNADPASLVCLMNRMVHENIRVRLGRDDFATLSLFRFYPDGRYVVAGAHEDIVVWRARTGRCEQIATQGSWVGIRERTESQMPNQENRLEEGDLMMLYTDGLTEARSDTGEQLGLDRLADALAHLHAEPTATICTRLLEQAKVWAPVQDDDQTLVVLRRQ